jgi:hypothetical protein
MKQIADSESARENREGRLLSTSKEAKLRDYER